MNKIEINKKICEELEICWHEVSVFKDDINCQCSCDWLGRPSLLKEHLKLNPDFTENAAVLLSMIDEDKLEKFLIDIGWFKTLDYLFDPHLLCEKFLEWRKK